MRCSKRGRVRRGQALPYHAADTGHAAEEIAIHAGNLPPDLTRHRLAGKVSGPIVRSIDPFWQRVGATVVATTAGFVGFGFLFSDFTWGLGHAIALLFFFFVPGFMVGLLFPRGWAFSGLVGWGGLGWIVLGHVSAWMTPNDLPILELTVTEGTVILSPDTIRPGDLRIRQQNRGRSAHEIAIAEGSSGMDAQFTLDRLDPGESDESVFQGIFVTGRYVFFCLRHPGLREVATLTVAQDGNDP